MQNITITDTTAKQDRVIDAERAQYNLEYPLTPKTSKQFLVMKLDEFVEKYVRQKRQQQRQTIRIDNVTDDAFDAIKAIADANQTP